VVDTVTSLGGFPVQVDAWGIDAVYSGTQKCMSCPPGLSPVSFSEKAVRALDARTKKVQSWYLDLTMVRKYWGQDRVYHHTAPISMVYALREALRIIHEEGLDARFDRHRRNHEALVAGVEAMGLSMLVDEGHRLWMLNAVCVPAGVDEPQVRQTLLNDYNMEIGAGLGDLAGKIWRIGLMGESSTRNNVLLALAALEDALGRQGHHCDPGAGVEAAMKRYALEE
jgi:alanine-glyoxylate transaminase/serine-glyoxylate transaminase/serine-pyruvate transaminase